MGALVRLDQVYDLVEGNIGSEVRAKIAAIAKELSHPLAQPVAKVICLLQYVKSVHRTAENIAAALHPGSRRLAARRASRRRCASWRPRTRFGSGDDGYRIPTPAEDDWERLRNGINPKPGDAHRLYTEVLDGFWQPQPSYTLFETKTFKAGLADPRAARSSTATWLFHVHLATSGKEFQVLATELRTRSQQERKNVFWAVALTTRSTARPSSSSARRRCSPARSARRKGEDTTHSSPRRRSGSAGTRTSFGALMKAACLSGSVYFRGNDRSPGTARRRMSARARPRVLGDVLPESSTASRRPRPRRPMSRRASTRCSPRRTFRACRRCSAASASCATRRARPSFDVESGPLQEVTGPHRGASELRRHGERPLPRGRVRQGALRLGLRGRAPARPVAPARRASRGDQQGADVRFGDQSSRREETFSNNNLFRQPRSGRRRARVRGAGEGRRSLPRHLRQPRSRSSNAGADRGRAAREVDRHEDDGRPRSRDAANAIACPGRTCSRRHRPDEGDPPWLRGQRDHHLQRLHRSIKDAIKRAAELDQADRARLEDIERARQALRQGCWPFLR